LQIDNKLFKGLLTLTGTAIASMLQEYKTGQFKHIEFLQKNSSGDFDAITAIIQDVQDNSAQCYEFQCSHLVSLMTSLTVQEHVQIIHKRAHLYPVSETEEKGLWA